MANILKVTQPVVPGYENNAKTNPVSSNDVNIKNLADPTKVIRTDGRTEYAENTENKYALNYESNFEKFAQMLKETPQITEVFSKFFFSGMTNLVSSGISENFAEEISQFMELMKMNEQELLSFVKEQSSTAVRFKGAFFNVLKQVMNQTQSIELKAGILDFVKRYNDMSTGKHLMENITTSLKEICQSVFRSAGEDLEAMMAKFSPGTENGDVEKNAQILKNEIIPYLSKYIGKTHDMGKVRDLITVLTLNLARYENGGKEGVIQSFKHLLNFTDFNEKLGMINEASLMAVLTSISEEKNEGPVWMDKLVNIIRYGMKGEAGYENKQVFQNVINSMLLNESVYVPILHMMLPVELNGNKMFSEIWVDPDAQDQKSGGDSGSEERKVKLLIKFDIKDVGYFDLIMLYKEGRVDMQLFYPEQLSGIEKNIRTGLHSIMQNNGLTFQSLQMEKSVSSKNISEVFPQIYERRNSINVRI